MVHHSCFCVLNKINLGNDKGEERYARIPFKYWKSSCICVILWNCITLLGSILGYVLLRYSILFPPELNALGPLYSSIWSLILYSPFAILLLDCSGRLIAKKWTQFSPLPVFSPFELWLLFFYHRELESIFLPLNSRLAFWVACMRYALAKRMRWKWHVARTC